MLRLLRWLVIPFILGAVTGNARAQCTGFPGVVVFGNGILTELVDDAFISLNELENALLSHGPGPLGPYEYFVEPIYNDSVNPVADLLESWVQDFSTSVSQFWRVWGGLEIMPEGLRQLAADEAAFVDVTALVTTDSLQKQVAFYRAQIREGKKVLLVAHSQGTFYANQAFRLLREDEQRRFGIVAVALMDDFVAGNHPYITLEEDFIVNAVREALTHSPLPATTSNGFATTVDNQLGHHFVKSYLARGSNSRSDIQNAAMLVLQRIDREHCIEGLSGPGMR